MVYTEGVYYSSKTYTERPVSMSSPKETAPQASQTAITSSTAFWDWFSSSPSLVALACAGELPHDQLITWPAQLDQEMTKDDAVNFQKASWSNGNPFLNTWKPDHATINKGMLSLILDDKGCPQSCDGKPYASGEYRTTKETYSYGYYETRMKPVAGNGLVSAFFVYTGTWGQPSHQEIDFEILGKDCSAQLNYYTNGQGGHEKIIPLAPKACQEFHNYGFKWSSDQLTFYIDGKEVHSVTSTGPGSLPHGQTKIMANFWAGIGVDSWLNPFNYPGQPLTAQYDWIKYSPLDKKSTPANFSTE